MTTPNVTPIKRGQAAVEWSCGSTARSLTRGQAAVEALAYSAFFLLAFVATTAVFLQLQSQEASRAEHAFAQEIAYGFADQIRVAFIAGSGFSQTVEIPEKLLGKPYTLSISSALNPSQTETGFVYVVWDGPSRNASFSSPTVTAAYNASFSGPLYSDSGRITINPSFGTKIRMNNYNGTIQFSNGG